MTWIKTSKSEHRVVETKEDFLNPFIGDDRFSPPGKHKDAAAAEPQRLSAEIPNMSHYCFT